MQIWRTHDCIVQLCRTRNRTHVMLLVCRSQVGLKSGLESGGKPTGWPSVHCIIDLRRWLGLLCSACD